jgi:hypothetical protein
VGHPALSEIEAKKRKKKRKELGGDANALLGLVLVMDMKQLSFSFLSSLGFGLRNSWGSFLSG